MDEEVDYNDDHLDSFTETKQNKTKERVTNFGIDFVSFVLTSKYSNQPCIQKKKTTTQQRMKRQKVRLCAKINKKKKGDYVLKLQTRLEQACKRIILLKTQLQQAQQQLKQQKYKQEQIKTEFSDVSDVLYKVHGT